MAIKEVIDWRQKMREKRAAKDGVIAAMSEARLLEKEAAGEPLQVEERDALASFKDKDIDKRTSAIAAMGMPSVAEREADPDNVGGSEGKAFAAAKEIAVKLKEAKPELFAFMDGAELPDAVSMVDAFRMAGNEDMADLVDMYIMATWAPQQIGGDVAAVARRL